MRTIKKDLRKLIEDLKPFGVNFSFDQEMTTTQFCGVEKTHRLSNVIFEKDGKEFKIFEGYFFRDSGQCVYYKIDKDDVQCLELTDDIFYGVQKSVILDYFKLL